MTIIELLCNLSKLYNVLLDCKLVHTKITEVANIYKFEYILREIVQNATN